MRDRGKGHDRHSRFVGASATALALAAGLWASTAQADTGSLLLRDSFPLGSGGSKALCQVQSRTTDPANRSPMDRTWAIVCRDSALPVGHVFALRHGQDDELARLAERRRGKVTCDSAAKASVAGRVRQECRWNDPDLAYEVVSVARGNTTFVVEGFSAYHGALDLALRSIYADRLLDEPIEVATTSVNDTEAYARIQALTLDPATALAEGYRRNNSGDYAEAAAYFETLDQRQASTGDVPIDRVEFLVNAGLQRSNLGQFAEADRLFAEADALPAGSGVVERLRRNYETIHLLNQERYDDALARLGLALRRTSAMGAESLRDTMELTPSVSRRINASDLTANAMGLVDDLRLTDDERATILDAQALQLRGTALRLQGKRAKAQAALEQAQGRALSVRNGRVVSIVRMRAQLLTELASIAEDEGRQKDAESLLRSAVDIVGVQYPETRSLAAAQARLASYLARHDRADEAAPIYREVVSRSVKRENGLSGLSKQMVPYFDLLTARMNGDAETSNAFFEASQILVRPGVAETQAVLSRELSAGSDEASRLFRQSNSLTRAVERARMTYAALQRLDDAAARTDEIADAAKRVADLEAQEQATVIELANYARYRVVTQSVISQKELQDGLGADEVYAKMAVLGPDVFVFFASKNRAVGYRAAITAGELDKSVKAIRDSISRFDGKQYVTGTFAANEAAGIYKALFGPVSADLAAAHHLIFEPDGAMLKLPVNVLIADEASAKAYIAQASDPAGDPFDLRGVKWLAQNKLVSTAVSARAFMDARKVPGSKAHEAYLGLGRNAAVTGTAAQSVGNVRGGAGDMTADCNWPLATWSRPISEAELLKARMLLSGQGTDLMVGSAFSDTAIKARSDLDNFRILHFATHGLVTPPRPTCPARPALVTSFGPQGSDGLLSFAEIFDLKLDADMVILSACDTAGEADVTATRDAGIVTGGGSALEGLVRAFIGAGSRSVLASHWPAPDDFDATARLINGLFAAKAGTPSGEALLKAQQQLMSDVDTSHPYYWAGFAVIGDGARPLVAQGARMAALATGTSAAVNRGPGGN
ncbi:CHAT domain-containing protein [Novosphingobium jiangmenense]|uniref:CHAT domain-containing protein n=1 Tax=Novosphingobium jiangmenense TaxID=2791981 RepID=A0ABS0HHQ0_9SPHN|nr:CHAT domain-containing protein [Novosphingobium jiangmenense]MBF9151780.1 CHAT domain-containing protein [Novosphingobium jiangmenense]